MWKRKSRVILWLLRDVVKEDGMYNGEKYTHKQTNIRYNHVVIIRDVPDLMKPKLDSFRMDSETDIAFRIDAEVNSALIAKEETDCTANKEKTLIILTFIQKGEAKNGYFKIDGIEYEGAQEIVNRVTGSEKELAETKNPWKLRKPELMLKRPQIRQRQS